MPVKIEIIGETASDVLVQIAELCNILAAQPASKPTPVAQQDAPPAAVEPEDQPKKRGRPAKPAAPGEPPVIEETLPPPKAAAPGIDRSRMTDLVKQALATPGVSAQSVRDVLMNAVGVGSISAMTEDMLDPAYAALRDMLVAKGATVA